jgi:hypothetical protein
MRRRSNILAPPGLSLLRLPSPRTVHIAEARNTILD